MFNWLQSLLGSKPATPPPLPPTRPPPLPAVSAERARPRSARDTVRDQILSGRAPDDFVAETIDLSGERAPFRLPARLRCVDLLLDNSSVAELPPDVIVANRIDLTGCKNLRSLPRGLRTGTLVLAQCTALETLPEELAVHFLVLDGCTALRAWPDSARVTLGRVSAVGCSSLEGIPATLGPLSSLRLQGCDAVRELPAGGQILASLELDERLRATLTPELRALIRP